MKPKINIPKSFFGFLLASIFFWMLINLSKEYVTTIDYYVTFDKLAENKIFEEKPIQEIQIKVKGTGFKLISANFSKRNISIKADKLGLNSAKENYILPNKQSTSIQNQLYSGLQLEKVLLDTIFLNLGTLDIKKVPVLVNNKLVFQLGYDLASSIEVVPDSILLSGSKIQLSTITSINTKEVELVDVSESVTLEVDIEKSSKYKDVRIHEEKVQVTINVDKFTEGEFEVPFDIINLPKDIELNTYPKTLKVIYKVGLNNFNKISAESFKVVCDYKYAKENELSYLIPKIESQSHFIQISRLSPNKIDFLIQK